MAFDINRILVADDDERPRQLLAHYLKSWGFTVTECRDGLEAAAVLEADNAPGLAVVDWMMPGLEGVEVCRRIRRRPSNHPYIYILLVTGNSDAAAGLEAGADDFINKPYNVDELKARLAVGQRVVALERRLAEHIALLRDALNQVAQLPETGTAVCVCPACKRLRDGSAPWQPVEQYLKEHSGAHSVSVTCPDCQEKLEQMTRAANPLRQMAVPIEASVQPGSE